MKSEIKYIELKSGYHDDGPAWIGMVEFSKTGQTIYFNGHAFKGNGHGLCFDIETKETYWITGVKKDSQNRHWAGKGKIMIDKLVVDDYLKLKGWPCLDLNKYEYHHPIGLEQIILDFECIGAKNSQKTFF